MPAQGDPFSTARAVRLVARRTPLVFLACALQPPIERRCGGGQTARAWGMAEVPLIRASPRMHGHFHEVGHRGDDHPGFVFPHWSLPLRSSDKLGFRT